MNVCNTTGRASMLLVNGLRKSLFHINKRTVVCSILIILRTGYTYAFISGMYTPPFQGYTYILCVHDITNKKYNYTYISWSTVMHLVGVVKHHIINNYYVYALHTYT